MKKGIIVNLKKIKILDYVNINKIFLFLVCFLIIGIIVGSTVLYENTFINGAIEDFFKKYISIHTTQAFVKKFFNCFLRYLFIIILYFLSGSGLFAIVLVPFLIVWQGILVGNLISYIYEIYGINGIAFNSIIIIPPTLIFTITCFYVARYAIDFSLLFIRLTLPHSRPMNLYSYFKNYSTKFLLYILIIVLCSIIEIILNLFFLKFFNY